MGSAAKRPSIVADRKLSKFEETIPIFANFRFPSPAQAPFFNGFTNFNFLERDMLMWMTAIGRRFR